MRVIRWQVVARVFLVIAVAASVMVVGTDTATSAEQKAVTLEGLLKEGQIDYIKAPEGYFKIIVTIEDETTLVMAEEESLAGRPDLRLALLYTGVLQVPEGVQPSRAMLKKMAELNGSLLIGNLSLEEDTVFYNSSFWLDNANSKILGVELALAHMIRSGARKELLPFVEEE